MPLYVADYLADTGHLSTVEHGAYMLLIMHYWSTGGLPDDDKRLASIARATLEQWSEMRSTIAEFFGDGWKHARIDEELENAAKAYERRASAGRAGGKAKAMAQQSASIATAMPEQSHSQPHTQKEKEEPKGSSKKRGERLPEGWVPDEVFARSEGLSVSECSREAEKFRDYWRGQPGQRGVKLDWDATWKNWVRKAADSSKTKPAKDWRDEPEYRGIL